MRRMWLLFLLLLPSAVTGEAAAQKARPPNFVVLLADDLGYGDLGIYGHPTLMTPNLDRMAREGIKLTSFYVAASACTPSRTALLTGRYPMRSGLHRVLYPEDVTGIPESELTLAEALKPKGYKTMAIGKWHLGHAAKKYLPAAKGFDDYFGLLYSNDMQPPWVATEIPLRLYHNGEPVEYPVDLSALTERYTDEAVRFIRRAKSGPFFLYLPYTMPHVPLAASGRFSGKSLRGLYGDVVETIDWSVGRILETVGEEGLERTTLVVFTSDNGPWLREKENGGSAGLLRDGKGTTYEGGMREPFIARWPGRIPKGLTSAEVASAMDIYATLLTLAGVPLPKDRVVDGKNILPILEGSGRSPHEAFYYYTGPILEAVRAGKWKLRIGINADAWKGKNYGAQFLDRTRNERRTFTMSAIPGASGPKELFDLDADPSERFNLAEKHPDIVERLLKQMEDFAAKLTPGPAFAEASRGVPRK